MALLAKLHADKRGIVDIHRQTTYGALNGIVRNDRQGGLNFAAVLNETAAPYTNATYERVVMLLTGGFAD
jgi:hypothetical protein